MKKEKKWLKYICYYIIGFLIFILLSSITQINTLNNLNISIDLKIVIVQTIANGIVLYTIIYFLILILNILYNVKLINKLNKTTEKIRKASKEKILKERREITMKKKVLIIILIIVLIALIIFIFNLIGKANIIGEYSSKLKEYQNMSNFYAKFTYTSLKDDDIRTSEIWKKDDIVIQKDILEDGNIRTNYYDKDNILILTDNGDAKEGVKMKNTENFGKFIVLEDGTFSIEDNLWENIKAAFTTKISTEKVNGKEFYKFYISDDFQFIVDKDNMLKIKEINANQKVELVDYSIGNVTKEDVKIPSTVGYDIKEN